MNVLRKKKSLSFIALFACFVFLSGAQSAVAQTAFSDPADQAVEEGGRLEAVEDNVNAGTIPLGSTAQVITRFQNNSGRIIEFRDVNLYPSSTVSASVAVNECANEPLVSGAECAIIIAVKGLQPGSWRTEMLIRHTGRSRLVSSRISGTVEAGEENVNLSRDLEINPTPVDFGTLEASRPIIRSVTVRNITSQAISVSDMFIDAPQQSGYSLRTDCADLASGQACIASILWSPNIEGPSSGFLVIQHDGPSAVTNVPLNGTFAPGLAKQAELFPNSSPGKGVLVSSETEIDFGTGINAQSAITISLVNVGDADLTLTDISMAGSENGLKLLSNGCETGTSLSPTEACPMTISWAPTKVGSVIDDVRINHNGARGVLVLPIRGTASEAISIDSKPIIMTQDENGVSVNVSNQNAPERPVLDGYSVTSMSAKHAIIKGPVGSRIVADGKKALIGGYEWNVDIVDTGVRLSSGNNSVLLVFDRSLSSMQSESGGGAAAGSVQPSTIPAPATSSAPAAASGTGG